MTARQNLLDYLATRETASPAEIARALGCSAANARHHLSVLVREGAVAVVGGRQLARPGRPAQLYALAQPTQRHNLDQLAAAALALLLTRTPPEQHSFLLRELAAEVAGPLPATRSLTLRLSFAIQRLNDMGYHARWEAHAAGPRLILGHCPYTAILPQLPLLCAFDAALLSTLVGERATQHIRLEPAASGLPYCLFQVEPGRI